MQSDVLSPAAHAFDAVAHDFDSRFGHWLSVSAQRNAVRRTLAEVFPDGSRILEIGGGTGEDAAWLLERGYDVLLTDASPQMVQVSARKLAEFPMGRAVVASAEALEELTAPAMQPDDRCGQVFDGAFSNFAALNCVPDLSPVARGLARLIREGGALVLVVFGTLCPGEVVVELARRRPRAAIRRLSTRSVDAGLSGRRFPVRYHRQQDIVRALQPWFRIVRRRGIGVCVPPSAAEPWISRHPRALRVLERLDRVVADALAPLGDHVLYQFERTMIAAPPVA